MRIRDWKITRQLNAVLIVVLLLILTLSASAWLTAHALWRNTEDLYLHPLTVRRAIGELTADILMIHRDMRQLVAEEQPDLADELLLGMATLDAAADRQIDQMYAAYLGPKRDIDEVADALAQWRLIRAETIRLFRAGHVPEARDRVKSTGVGGRQADVILAEIDDISLFSYNKGESFYNQAQLQIYRLTGQQVVISAVILILLILVGAFLKQAITNPLQKLSSTADAFGQGNLSARSQIDSANEYGALSAAFDAMASGLQEEIGHKDNLASLSAVMLQQDELKPFCEAVLTSLMRVLPAEMAVCLVLNKDMTAYEPFVAVGSNDRNRHPISVAGLEGEFGLLLKTGQIVCQEIPEDASMVYSTLAGDFRARQMLLLPVKEGDEIVALLALYSLQPFQPAARRLLTGLANELSARYVSLVAEQRVAEYAQTLQETNAELAAQARELAAQTDELTEQNIELEIQKQQLDEASQLKSTFLSNMSHELRTPLNSIIALSSVLSRRLHDKVSEDESGYLKVIERNGSHLLRLVNEILDLSRIEAGRDELLLSSFSLRQLVDEICAAQMPEAQGKGIELINRVGDDLPHLSSDLAKCLHILQNLIGNAIKFTQDGSVTISAVFICEQGRDEIKIEVCDTGIGIAPADQAIIFEAFRQVDESPARRSGGTGLGLAIARRYAELLQGRIEVASMPGRGSVFTVFLPRVLRHDPLNDLPSVPATDWPDQPVPVNPQPAGLAGHVLLVDDSEPAIIQITDILTEQGYRVDSVNSGRAALDFIDKVRPDGIILDLMMPEMDGFTVLKTIRSAVKNADIPVLILTAKQITQKDIDFFKTNHINQLIQKGSVAKADLLAAVARLVRPDRAASPKPSPWTDLPARPVILIVEDNPDNRITVQAILKDTYETVAVSDGSAALAQLPACRPHLVLLDIELPGLDGFAVLQAIRQMPDLPRLPVIALTARAMAGDRAAILAHGFDGYIAKPIDANELLCVIRRFLYGV
jgi:signal transduction histidine kinase/DNA-binding response OmpR family regulator/HAMP domain-containing protein